MRFKTRHGWTHVDGDFTNAKSPAGLTISSDSTEAERAVEGGE